MRIEFKFLFFVIALLFFQCKQTKSPVVEEYKPDKLEKIRKSGVIRVVTDYNSTSYFIYRGQPMGYQFELLQELADFLNVKLEVTANNSMSEKFEMLAEEKVDLIAVNLTITKERKEFLDFTEAHTKTRQVLVQRKPDNWTKLSKAAVEEQILSEQLELGGKTIHVQRNSVYAQRLQNLSEEIGDSINIIESDKGLEELIQMVANGEIDYTVSDENVAKVNRTYYANLDINLPVSFSQKLAWAVDKGEDGLREVINNWLIEFRKTRKYAILYDKYFENKRSSRIVESDLYANQSGTISPFDNYIKEYSDAIGWDWRLIASMVYQESRFNPEARSWAGAFGLMQLMPNTAKRFGVTQNSSVKQQIRAGVMFIQWLDNLYSDITDIEERQKFVLGSYNVGPGHVMDARRLAEKYGKNPSIWDDNVNEFLLKKSHPEFYKDPVVKYGYCRGIETYRYVTEVVDRYDHYKNIVN
jgi:membrane-bound lytic murein transglycosylase F